MVQYWSHSRRSFQSSRARARFSTTLYIVQIRLTAPNLVQICEGIADGTSVTARRRSVLLERHSPAFTGSRRAGSSICTVSAGKSDANGALPAVGSRTSHGSSLRPPRKMGAPVPRRRTLRLLRPAGHSFALRAKWARQGRAAERFAFFAPPGMAPPSASLRGSAFVYFRRFPPLRNLQQPALRALFCIHVGIEKYPPPPENFGAWGAVCTRAIPPSATLLRRRCRFHSGCKKLIIQMPPWSQNRPFATGSKSLAGRAFFPCAYGA